MKNKIQIFFLIIFSYTFSEQIKNKLSDYNLYKGDPHNLITNEQFIPYELITPLFTDYAYKHRTIYIPPNTKITYYDEKVFEFPIGTIITKTFYYPHDFNNLSKGISLKETRVMIHEESGWVGFPYIWNEDETDAYLEPVGGIKNAEWIDSNNNKQIIDYIVPNMNQCKSCHHRKNNIFLPIGPTARQLNSNYNYKDGIKNQIEKWNELGFFYDFTKDVKAIPEIAKWDDPELASLDKRARAWLDINCAHCHNIDGPANNTGLFLDYYQTDTKSLGIFKTPVAAGRGSGHLKYDIYPGFPDKSIMVYRFNSTDPGIMMPEIGRTIVHKEGLDLIEEWIKNIDLSRVEF